MKAYIQAGFGYPIGLRTLDWIGDLGFLGVRQCIPWGIPQVELATLLNELVQAGMEALLIVGGWDVWDDGVVSPRFRDDDMPSSGAIGAFARHVAEEAKRQELRAIIEVGNEPEITAAFKLNPGRYADTVRRVAAEVGSIRVAAGSIHDLTPESREYLGDVLSYGIPERTIVAVHPYRPGNKPWEPFTDFRHISEAATWLRTIWPHGEIAVSEIGWHTAPRMTGAGFLGLCRKSIRWTDEEIAKFARWELNLWQQVGSLFLTWYQLNDGPNDVESDRYGIRDQDGVPKPVAQVFKEFAVGA